MFRSIKVSVQLATAFLLFFAAPASGQEHGLGLGRPLTPEALKTWDIDVRSDGNGLPAGKGTVDRGEEIFAEQCAVCHGEFGEGIGRIPALIGGEDSLATDQPNRRVGSFWPYAPTLFDYVRRTMPFGNAQSLTVDETYSLTALILNMNDLWEKDKVLTGDNLADVRMPNREGFVGPAPRPDTSNRPCMWDCKDSANIVSRGQLVTNQP